MFEKSGNRGLGQLKTTECVLTPMPREALFADLQKWPGSLPPAFFSSSAYADACAGTPYRGAGRELPKR
jgi:hypothetical protein